MPLIGDQQDEDRALMADLVLAKMNQTMPHTSSPTPVRSQVNTFASKHPHIFSTQAHWGKKTISAKLYYATSCRVCDIFKGKCPMSGAKSAFSFIQNINECESGNVITLDVVAV